MGILILGRGVGGFWPFEEYYKGPAQALFKRTIRVLSQRVHPVKVFSSGARVGIILLSSKKPKPKALNPKPKALNPQPLTQQKASELQEVVRFVEVGQAAVEGAGALGGQVLRPRFEPRIPLWVAFIGCRDFVLGGVRVSSLGCRVWGFGLGVRLTDFNVWVISFFGGVRNVV